jgi:phospholipid/cholesterol/gamma-HCH transport system substrate-binding protein
MAKERNALKAGLFILVSIALIIGITVGIKGFTRWVEPEQRRTVRFRLSDDVGGLRRGDEVRVGGVKEGEIRAIELVGHDTPDPKDDAVSMTFSLPRRIVLREGASIRVQSTLTGVAWLNIDGLGSGGALAPDVALLGKPGSMNELFASVGELAPELRAAVRDIRDVTLPKVNTAVDRASDTLGTFKETGAAATDFVKDLKTQTQPMIQKFSAVADRANEAMTQVRDILGEGKSDISGMLANINAVTGDIRTRLPGILQQVDEAMTRVNTAVDQASATLVELKATAENLKDASASARSLLVGNRGKLNEMVDSLNVTGNNLKAASVEIRHSPWRLLYKPKKGEMANLNLYDSTRQFAEGANELNDAAAALRDALKDPGVDQSRVQTLVEKLDASFNNFKQVEDALWERVQE